jgi:hypothetical protein
MRLNVEMLSPRRIESGSDFHTFGAATAKARLASVVQGKVRLVSAELQPIWLHPRHSAVQTYQQTGLQRVGATWWTRHENQNVIDVK